LTFPAGFAYLSVQKLTKHYQNKVQQFFLLRFNNFTILNYSYTIPCKAARFSTSPKNHKTMQQYLPWWKPYFPTLLQLNVCFPIRARNVSESQVQRYLLGVGGLLSHQTQLLLPLLSHLGDDGVEEAELFAPLVHLVLGVLEHHLEAVVSQDAGESLQVR